jgi:hypothetical protein
LEPVLLLQLLRQQVWMLFCYVPLKSYYEQHKELPERQRKSLQASGMSRQ